MTFFQLYFLKMNTILWIFLLITCFMNIQASIFKYTNTLPTQKLFEQYCIQEVFLDITSASHGGDLCTGTILKQPSAKNTYYWILTAAHCFRKLAYEKTENSGTTIYVSGSVDILHFAIEKLTHDSKDMKKVKPTVHLHSERIDPPQTAPTWQQLFLPGNDKTYLYYHEKNQTGEHMGTDIAMLKVKDYDFAKEQGGFKALYGSTCEDLETSGNMYLRSNKRKPNNGAKVVGYGFGNSLLIAGGEMKPQIRGSTSFEVVEEYEDCKKDELFCFSYIGRPDTRALAHGGDSGSAVYCEPPLVDGLVEICGVAGGNDDYANGTARNPQISYAVFVGYYHGWIKQLLNMPKT